MPTRAEKIAFIQNQILEGQDPASQASSREKKIEFIKGKMKELENAKKENEISPVTSGIRNAVQGLTGNLSDEGMGILEGAGRVIGVKGLGGPLKDIGLSEDGPTIDPEKIKQGYLEARDRERAFLKEDSDQNPASSFAGNLAGAAVSPLNKVISGMSLAKGGAVLGGINALGASEADNLADLGEETATGALLGGAAGKVIEKGAKAIPSAIQDTTRAVAKYISPAKMKEDAALIRQAADRLGIKVTPAMLDDSGFVERLESSLAKSPSFLGQKVKRNQDAVIEKLRGAGQETLKDASNLSQYQLGEKFKSGMTSKVSERLDPITTVFNEVAESTKNIPVSQKSLDAVKRNVENLDLYRLTGGEGKAGQYSQMLSRIKNVNDVKLVMTSLNQDIKAAQGSEKQVLIAIKDKLSNLEKNSTMRGAIQSAKEAGMKSGSGETIAKEIIGDLKDARTGYRDLAKDLTEVAEGARIKFRGGPTQFLDDLETIPSEKIQDKFLNPENFRQIENIAKKFPEEFELLKKGKLKEILGSSLDNSLNGQGKFSTQKFLAEVRDLPIEAKNALFGKSQSVISDIEAVQKSLPRNFNPTGSGSEGGWHDAIYRNVKDIPTYAIYKAASSNLADDIASTLLKSSKMRTVYEKNPALFQSVVNKLQGQGVASEVQQSIPMKRTAGETETARTPKKGPEKWANDGFEKIQKHAEENGQDLSSIDLEDPKTKNMLIAASDLKPGSKAMENLISKLTTKSRGK